MKLQAHYILSEIPLRQNASVYSLCEKEIRDARWVLEEVLEGKDLNLSVFTSTMRVCSKCMDQLGLLIGSEEHKRRKYLYGGISGEQWERIHCNDSLEETA